MRDSLEALAEECSNCRLCPRLVAHRESLAQIKRKAYRDQEYWGRPVAGWGDPRARLVFVGLAPGAHGSNRTGRPFTGDASGEFLYPALHRAGFASAPRAISRNDGLRLNDCWITASVRCAPPDNKPTPEEFARCLPFLERELKLLSRAVVFVTLGQLALKTLSKLLPFRSPPKFGHDLLHELADGRAVICSYHPSQQNTQTGRLTAAMFDAMLRRARKCIEQGGYASC